MTTLLQVNLNIRQGCLKKDGVGKIEVRRSNWPSARTESPPTGVMADTETPTDQDNDVTDHHSRFLSFNPGPSLRRPSGSLECPDNASTGHEIHHLADQFFFSNMLRNLLHQSRSVDQRHLPDAAAIQASGRRRSDKVTRKVSLERGTMEATRAKHPDRTRPTRNDVDKYARHDVSPPATALDLSISGAGGGPATSSSPTTNEFLWWCPGAGVAPFPWPTAPTSGSCDRQTPADPSIVQPWMEASGLAAALDPARAGAREHHQRLWSKIWRNVPLGELWLRQHLAPQATESTPPLHGTTSRVPDMSSDSTGRRRDFEHPARHRLSPFLRTLDSSSSSTSGRQTTSSFPATMRRGEKRCSPSSASVARLGKRSRSLALRPRFRTHQSSAFVAPEKRDGVSAQLSGCARRGDNRKGMAEEFGSKALKKTSFSVSVTPNVHYVMSNLKNIIVCGPPDSKPMTTEMPPVGEIQTSDLVVKKIRKEGENFLRISCRSEFEGHDVQEDRKMELCDEILNQDERHAFCGKDGGHEIHSNDDKFEFCRKDDSRLERNQDGRQLERIQDGRQSECIQDSCQSDCPGDDRCHLLTQQWSPTLSHDLLHHVRSSVADVSDQQLQTFLEKTMVAPPAAHLSPDCKRFSALIGLEIVVDYVQRNTNKCNIVQRDENAALVYHD